LAGESGFAQASARGEGANCWAYISQKKSQIGHKFEKNEKIFYEKYEVFSVNRMGAVKKPIEMPIVIDDPVKTLKTVTPAEVGVQNSLNILDSRLRGNDNHGKGIYDAVHYYLLK
jgi:hypothetical protein